MGVAESSIEAAWQGVNISFWILTLLVLVSGAFTAFSRSIVRAAYSLFFTLLGVAGYYVLLGSGFLAVTQIIIYVGGILVLLMFGVLLTNRSIVNQDREISRSYIIGGIVGGVFLVVVLAQIITSGSWHTVEMIREPLSTVRILGELLLDRYLLALETAGMTLLLCLIGAAYLVRRKEH